MAEPIATFEWDDAKNQANMQKHGVAFEVAQLAFLDPQRVIAEDISHGGEERRYYCMGQVSGGVLTVRFTIRSSIIRIFGAGYWRKGKKTYEKANQIH